jgi:uncharacterized iron-regulated membrane protein
MPYSNIARREPRAPSHAQAARDAGLARIVWRWHFYAGLIVLPVLVWLAVTGALYLYKPEVERALYRDWIHLGAPARPMPLAPMIASVEQASGARVTQLLRPAAPDESWRMTLADGDTRRTAFVHPADGRLLGITSEGGAMATVRDLHSLAITGPVGNALVEIVAGWAIILVVSGFYLWWPRGGRRALALLGRPRERRFWRDVHASVGALAGALILFLAVTGMPWSVFWGANLQALVAAYDLGRPAPPTPAPVEHHDAAHLPWSLQAAPAPHGVGEGDVGPDRAVASAEAAGLAAPYSLGLPQREGALYTLSRIVERASDARVIRVEPASGRVLQDVAHADFGPGARAIEWGIYTHQGTSYGEANRLAMLAGCIGILLLAASAPILWWKRRRQGRLEPPPRPRDRQVGRGFLLAMAALGLLYPLTGATMLAAWLADRLLQRRRPAAGA